MFRDVDCLLRPKVIAIIGASDSSRGGWSQDIYENLEYCNFPAKVYLVNPKRTELWGRPVYPDFASIPERVDLALTIVPSVTIPDTLAEAAANGSCQLSRRQNSSSPGVPSSATKAGTSQPPPPATSSRPPSWLPAPQ